MMKFTDLRFTAEDLDIFNSDANPQISDTSIYDIWPGFPEESLEGDSVEEILKQSIEALIDVLGCNCLTSEYINGVIIVHCGDIEAEVQNRYYNFRLL